MVPVVQVVSPGAALVVACVLVACAGVLVAVTLLRSARRRQAELDAALARSRDEVDSLVRKVDELSDEMVRARRTAELDREYVITSIGSGESVGSDGSGGSAELVDGRPVPSRPAVSRVVEDQLVDALARQPQSSPLGRRAVDVVVRTVALGHGVRRALSADVLDRAAAEAHVARRRSRRDRKRLARQTRRVVRSDQEPGREVA